MRKEIHIVARVRHKDRDIFLEVHHKNGDVKILEARLDCFGRRTQKLVQFQLRCELLGDFIHQLNLRKAFLGVIENCRVLQRCRRLDGEQLCNPHFLFVVRSCPGGSKRQCADGLIPCAQRNNHQRLHA